MATNQKTLRIGLSSIHKLNWPDRCALCGSVATRSSGSSFWPELIPLYQGIGSEWEKRRVFVPYPVCNKHKLLCDLLDIPSKLGIVTSLLAIFFMATGLWILIDIAITMVSELFKIEGSLTSYVLPIGAIFICSMITFYFLACYRFKPVAVRQSESATILINIRNKSIYIELRRLNSIID